MSQQKINVSERNQSALERGLRINTHSGRIGIIPYFNAGDPDLETSVALIKFFSESGARAIELGVAFPDSVTDGQIVKRSHQRVLSQNIGVDEVLDVVRRARRHCRIPIILLCEYHATVRTYGLERLIRSSKESGVDGVLLHCLPPLLVDRYLELANDYSIAPILSLFPATDDSKRAQVIKNASGFIYLVSQFGKTGMKSNDFSLNTREFFKEVRSQTDLPLAVGFGVASNYHLQVLEQLGIDAGIVGSPFVQIIEKHRRDRIKLFNDLSEYWLKLHGTCESE